MINKLSLLVAAMLGDDFSFEVHEQVLNDVVKYNCLDDIAIDTDIEHVKEIISANIFLS